jgi:hypothetical protein
LSAFRLSIAKINMFYVIHGRGPFTL